MAAMADMEVHSGEKRCAACNAAKPVSEFYVVRGRPISYCRKCDNRRRSQSRGSVPRPPRLSREEKLSRKAAYSRQWQKANRDRHAAYKRERLQIPAVRLRNRMSRALRMSLVAGKGRESTFAILGYTLAELTAHLERQFVKGMGWHNMGEWHIDHIVPLCEFHITDHHCAEFRRAWALPNLRPLWARENESKNGKRIFLL